MEYVEKVLRPLIDTFSLDYMILGNPAWKYVVALCLTILLYILLHLIKSFIRARVQKLYSKEAYRPYVSPVSQAISRTFKLTLFFFALYFSTSLLNLHGSFEPIFKKAVTVVFFLQIGFWLDAFVSSAAKSWLSKNSTLPVSSATGGIIRFILRTVAAVLVLLVLLDNLGVDVTALVAGLGIGGIAVALAVQNVLGDLLCSLSIALDEPFEVGDFIIFGDVMGTVERIGIRSTRIRSLSGEQIIVSNSDLVKGQIKNYKRMEERRVVFSLGVTYQTTAAQLRKIPEAIKSIIESTDSTRFDRCHFSKYGDSSLNFEVVYFVLSPEYAKYMDIQQSINLEIFDHFENEGIEFAYPTQTLFLEKSNDS